MRMPRNPHEYSAMMIASIPASIALLVLALYLSGCKAAATITPGSGKHLEEKEEILPDGTKKTTKISTEIIGPGYSGVSVEELNMGGVNLPTRDGTATTNNISYSGMDITASFQVLYVIGAMALIGGVVIGWVAGWGLGLSISAAGAALITGGRLLDVYPGIAVAAIVGLLAAGGYLAYILYRGDRARKLNQATAVELDVMPDEQSVPLIRNIEKRAGKARLGVRRELLRAAEDAGVA